MGVRYGRKRAFLTDTNLPNTFDSLKVSNGDYLRNMKRILLYGATGRTGGLVLNYALQQGYAITALVRNPAKLSVQSDNLTVIEGLPTSLDDVRKAMRGCDAVISTLSALSESEAFSRKKIPVPHTLETTMRNTIVCMSEQRLKRIVTLSSIGVGDSWPYAPWYMRLMIKLTNFKITFADHAGQEALLMKSDLDWVIARSVALNNNDELKALRVSYQKTPSPFSISRKQLALFMVDCLATNDFLRKAPILSEVA